MPSYKKRVHSQRIPQYERAAVLPYDGAYDEKYSSDEENVEYEVCEPEDLTERSNSTVTFSEDIYDSDAIDEMIKNQVRKPSQMSQEGLVKSDDVQHSDGSKPPKNILKGKGISLRNDGLSATVRPGSGPPSAGKDVKSVSGTEKISEGAVVEDGKLPEAVDPGKNDKDKKGEEFHKDVTKPLQGIITDQDISAKSENEVTKSSQSTIPQHIDQITDSATTNQYNFDRKGQVLEVITKQSEEHVLKEKPEKPSPGFSAKGTTGEDSTKISEDVTDESVTKILNASESGLKDKTAQIISTSILPTKTKLLNGKVPSGENLNEIANKLSEELEKSAAEIQIKTPDKRFEEITMEDAVEEAKKLIEDITQKVQDVLPSMVKPKDEPKVEQETVAENKTEKGAEKDSVQGKISNDASKQMPSKNGNIPSPTKSSEFQKNGHVLAEVGESLIKRMPDISKKVEPIAGYKAQNLLEEGPLKSLPTEKLDEKYEAMEVAKAEFSDSPISPEAVTESKERKNEQINVIKSKVGDIISDLSSSVAKTIEGTLSDITGTSLGVSEGRQEKEKNEDEAEANIEEKQPADKPRVIFRIDSEDDLLSESEPEAVLRPELTNSTEEFAEKMTRELKATIENEQIKLEERLTPLKSGIFDISDESLSKTKELVDERLRKISEIKPPKEIEEPVKKEKSPARTEEIKIGRFHITPALVEEVLNKTKEKEIAERLKTTRGKGETDETQEEVEKELPEKLTEADLEEVIRELKKEGLKTDVYLQPEEKEKEEKKERTLKRVERRFERMASETLEKEMEEAESEEKLDEKREVEFQRMVSNLSSEEVAEYQQEYQQLWEEGGLSSLTPSDDWDSRFPDTPENELEDDTPRKSESIRGSQGTGKKGEPKSSETKKSLKSPISPPKPIRLSDDISPSSLTPVDHSKIGSSPSEIDPTSGFVSERSEDMPTYDERKKFWEQMSSSQSSETASEIPRSMVESISSNESVDFDKKMEERLSVKGVKQKFEKEVTETDKTESEGGLVKSLTESYSKKIAAGELIMPAIPRPKSTISKESPEISSEIFHMPDSPGTAVVSELEVALKSRDSSAPITETVVPGSTDSEIIKPVEFIMGSTVITKTPEEVKPKALEIEGKSIKTEKEIVPPPSVRDMINEKSLEDDTAPPLPVRKSKHDRSLSLPPQELADSVRAKKKHFEEVMKKEMIVEQIMTQEETPAQKPKTPEKKLTPEIEEAASSAMTELLDKGVKIAEETLRVKGKTVKETSSKIITAGVNVGKKISDVPKSLHLKETHAEKSETEDNEKETTEKPKDEYIPSITISGVSRRQTETASIGESEDTQSESDVTPEDARVVDNGDAHWDGSGTQSGGYSPKDDMDYPKETTEKGIGRWIGQEDLSKSNWEKDDLDSSHFKIQTKWERTRSEGASPKEHYVYTPEEHYPDTVWEVPVQEQLEKEEITHDIPLEKQVIIEKDEEEEYEEEEGSREKLTEEEAKEIAEEILEYIQFEVENRSSFLINDEVESPKSITQAQVTDYLRHLAGGKDFDDQDVRLIESLLVKKQRDQFRKTQAANTTASSVDITDEELRSSVNDNDISPVESQMMKLQSLEKGGFAKLSRETTEELEQDDLIKSTTQICKDVEIVDQTIAEVKESLEAAQEQLIEQHKKQKTEIFKKESPSEFKFKGIDYEKTITEVIREQTSDWETTSEEVKSEAGEEILDQTLEELETEKMEKEAVGIEIKEMTKRFLSEEQRFKDVREVDLKTADKEKRKRAEKSLDDEKENQTNKDIKAGLLKEKDYQKDDLQEDDRTRKKGEDFTKHKSTSSGRKTETRADEFAKNLDITIPENFAVRRLEDQFFSDDSPRSTSDSIKSPPTGGEISGTQYDRQGDVKTDIHFRHPSGATLKADRRSGTDFEPYSSSGESHYHSFEQTSRPCSSDVEVLLAGNVNTTGSSEYESAVSQETSSKQATSADYHTAVSSLSSRESIRSLDSESSGHLASVEVSSEASETLIPSALELEKDVEPVLPDDENQTFRSSGGRHGASARNGAPGKTMDEDFEMVSESEVVSWAGEASEDDGEDEIIPNGDLEQKMKRSYEMTFQPEPMPIAFSESLEGLSRDGFVERVPFGVSVDENLSATSAPDERIGSSLEESGSVLSMSLSTTSEPSAVRTVIELSEKMESSLTVSAASIESREDVEPPITVPQTSETSTSTIPHSVDKKTASVTITTSSSDDHGIPSVSTQVTSVSRKSSMADETKSESSKSNDLSHTNGPTQSDYVSEYDDVETVKAKKPQGHKRKESTSNFVPTMIWNLSEAKTQKLRADITELEEEYGKDKYVYDLTLTEKEVKNDEKKESDDLEDQERGRKTSDGDEESKDYDHYRLQSQTSKTDSDSGQRPMSSAFSEDQPDSELSELMKQGSSETEKDDPLERPLSPEPEDMENKDITPEFSSEAQASVTELEIEYSGAYSRRDEYASHVSPIREEKLDLGSLEIESGKPLENEKITDGIQSQTSLESTVAEKHELETGEKEILREKSQEGIANDIPDITVTEHVTPVQTSQKFQYPETKEKKTDKTPDTPASTLSRTSSSSTNQGKEYNLDEGEIKKISREKEIDGKDEKESLDSPSSDSFEMLDKPDITDEFVIIEEVGREAQENDQEGKSIRITGQKKKPKKLKGEEEDEVVLSPPSPATRMTDLKYFPSEDDSELFPLETDSPPQPQTRKFVEKLKKKSSKEEKEEFDYEQQIEQSKKWIEMQFQGEPAAKIMGAYGYEMEFERAPLEDIKEEDINDLDRNSKMGSMGSQKESLGSFGSVKDSFGSTPDYDVLAGKKYFTRSGEHDDLSMSSLQEFELIEKKLMENGKKSGSSSSQDSLSSKKLGSSSKSGQGDDVSAASLREFEALENACATVVNMEKKAKQEEAILSEIDESHESQISESESCETVSAVIKEKAESEAEDLDKRMFEIDEIIKQAQTNVEKYAELQAAERVESMGRGDSYEEVAKVPDLELDMPLLGRDGSKTKFSTQVVTKKKLDEWRAAEKAKAGDFRPKVSELLENGGKTKSISVDSLEIQSKERQIIEGKDEDETISLDSYRSKTQKSDPYEFSEITRKCDSMEEVSACQKQHESSSGDYSSATEPTHRPIPRADFTLGSNDSLDPSSSTATHATYQYETDSVMSSSFTSCDSNTMVSSMDNLDLIVSGQSVINLSKDFGITKTGDWFENVEVGDSLMKTLIDKPDVTVHREKINLGDHQFVSETAEPLQDGTHSHIIHKKIQMAPEVEKVVFRGPDADKALKEYIEKLNTGEEVEEFEEVDEHGNVHVKRIIRQRMVIKQDDPLRVQKIAVSGKGAEKTLRDLAESVGDEIIEKEEVDEHGNVHVKKILKKKIFIRPEELTEEEIQAYSTSGDETRIHLSEVSPDVQKVLIRGPNAEKALEQHFKSQQLKDKIEEVEEVDEDGNVHIKKILKQHVVIRPEEFQTGHPELGLKNIRAEGSSRILTKDELQQYLDQIEEPEFREGESSEQIISSHTEMPVNIQKVTFRGPDAEKQLQEYLQKHQGGEVEEVEEVDEHGNVHVKRIIKHRMVIRPNDGEDRTQVQKVKFEGPGAELALKNYMAALGSGDEVEEIEEEDEHGNIRRRKVLRQRIVIRPEELGDKEITKEGLEEYLQKRSKQTTINFEKIDIGSNEPFVSEIIEPLDDDKFSHTIHRQVHMAPEVQKIVFRGPEAERAAQAYVERLEPGEDFEEREETDEDGNVHVTRILRRKIVLKPEDLEKRGLSGEELKSYLKQFEMETFEGGSHSFTPDFDPNQKLNQRFSSAFERTEKDRQSEEGKVEPEPSSAAKKESGISQRPPLVSDISMDDEAEYDTTEHDWRHQLEILHAEADEDEIGQDLDAALASSVELQKKK